MLMKDKFRMDENSEDENSRDEYSGDENSRDENYMDKNSKEESSATRCILVQTVAQNYRKDFQDYSTCQWYKNKFSIPKLETRSRPM